MTDMEDSRRRQPPSEPLSRWRYTHAVLGCGHSARTLQKSVTTITTTAIPSSFSVWSIVHHDGLPAPYRSTKYEVTMLIRWKVGVYSHHFWFLSPIRCSPSRTLGLLLLCQKSTVYLDARKSWVFTHPISGFAVQSGVHNHGLPTLYHSTKYQVAMSIQSKFGVYLHHFWFFGPIQCLPSCARALYPST
jgi:hypothetical protein